MKTFHALTPGTKIKGDWFDKSIPKNITVGTNCLVNSAHCFINYHSNKKLGLLIGDNSVFYETSFAVEESGFLEIGSNCFFSNTSHVVSKKITIGNDVFIAGGVTIVDSNFHPLDPVTRMQDVIALSPSGDRSQRPKIEANPVRIGNNVWIGQNAAIMSGVHVGDDVTILPGSVVIRSVNSGETVAGNPAKPIE